MMHTPFYLMQNYKIGIKQFICFLKPEDQLNNPDMKMLFLKFKSSILKARVVQFQSVCFLLHLQTMTINQTT